jgi:PAS domain S-box-containing protein
MEFESGMPASTGEEHFRLVCEAAPAMLWLSDANGKCVYLNKTLREFWGVSSPDVSNFDWSTTIHPDDGDLLYPPFSKAMSEHLPFQIEARYRRADGEYRILQTNAQPRFTPAGLFAGMVGVNLDVTDARLAERALQEESRALEILNRTGAAVAAELDLDRVVQYVTDAGVDLTGAQFGAFFYNVEDESCGSYNLFCISGVDRAAFAQFPMPRATKIFQPTFAGEGVIRSDDISLDPNYGKSAPYYGLPKGHLPVRSYLAVPVVSRSGQVLGGLFFGHEDRAVFEERSERLVKGLSAQAAVAIDNSRMFQAKEREIHERRRVEEALNALNTTLEQQVAERTEALRLKDETLRQSQKMESIGKLTGGIAHDFNNLLAVINGNLQLLQRRLDRGDVQSLARYVTHGLEASNKAAGLTHQLLAFARQQPLKPEPVDVNNLVKSVIHLLERTLGAQIEIQTNLLGSLWLAHADPNQLEHALINLAVNARDAMPSGGKLVISTDNCRLDEKFCMENPGNSPGDYVLIRVSDNGSGMAPEVAERAFDPFFTTKPPSQGTGLGLSQVYGFVKQTLGQISLRSDLGRGTEVDIYLPRDVRMPSENREDTKGTAHSGGGKTILVVEDNEAVRLFSTEALQELGYGVVEAKDGKQALHVLQSTKIDLLFTDIVMPDINGNMLAREALQLQPDLKVVLTTGYFENQSPDGGPAADMKILAKPFTVEDLAETIGGVLRS